MTNALSLIPQPQLESFARLHDKAKDEYFAWADAVVELQSAEQGSTPLTPIYQKIAARLKCSARSVRRKLADFRNGTHDHPAGDWRILVRKYWLANSIDDSDLCSLPSDFVDFWRGLAGANQRKCRPQRRALLRRLEQWRKGDPTAAIPGYDAPPPNLGRTSYTSPTSHPRGWSERNLYRLLATPETRVELALQRIGTAAAIQLLPAIPGTRAGVRFLEYVMFDDVWLDRKIVVPGYPNPVRLLQLGCLDYATGVYLKFGQRPELPTDTGARERLKERDMKWLVAMILEEWGYPLDYDMHLVLEHGTATLREHDCRALFDWSGGRIKPCYSTMEGQLVLAWEERGKGNPRAKAALESWHNLFHNENGALIGQVGKDRDHSPAALMGMEREARNLATSAAFLTPADRARLRFPFADREQAHRETLEVVHRINTRTDHECEGFETILEWRLKGVEDTWRSEAALASLCNSCNPSSSFNLDLIEWRSRKESPLERLARIGANVPRGKITPGLLCKFYEDCRVQKSLSSDGLFKFTFEGKEYIFGPGQGLRGDVEYLGHFPPVDPGHIHLTLDGAYIATLPRVRRIQRGDHQALAAAIKHKHAELSARVTAVQRRHADKIKTELDRMRHNADIINNNSTMLSGSHGLPLAAAYAAETDLARDRARTQQILEGRVTRAPDSTASTPSTESTESIDSIDSILSTPSTNQHQHQPNVTDDELNSIL